MRIQRSLIACFMVAAALAAGRVHAEDSLTVQAGKAEVVAGSKQTITVTPPSSGSAVVIHRPADAEAPNALLYLAPQTTTPLSETLAYQLGAENRTVKVSVTTGKPPPTLGDGEIYEKSFKALFVLFMIATILESGLAVLFNWRPFIRAFDGRGIKTLISVAFSYCFVTSFDLDIVTTLVNAYSGSHLPVNTAGKIVTTLVIAGGSSAVNQLFLSLGLRAVKTAEEVTPKPPKTEAWLAVAVTRSSAKSGPIMIFIQEDGAAEKLAGVVTGIKSTPLLLRWLLRDYTRFPTTGGYPVAAGKSYKLRAQGTDAQGNMVDASWGAHVLAGGAIVDIDMKV